MSGSSFRSVILERLEKWSMNRSAAVQIFEDFYDSDPRAVDFVMGLHSFSEKHIIRMLMKRGSSWRWFKKEVHVFSKWLENPDFRAYVTGCSAKSPLDYPIIMAGLAIAVGRHSEVITAAQERWIAISKNALLVVPDDYKPLVDLMQD